MTRKRKLGPRQPEHQVLPLPAGIYHWKVGAYEAGVCTEQVFCTAPDGLIACNVAERRMGLSPPQWFTNEEGKLQVKHWHGVEFRARKLGDVAASEVFRVLKGDDNGRV